MINTVLRDAVNFRRDGVDVNLSVNISTEILADLEMPDIVQQAIDTWDVPASSLTFEITESAMIGDVERSLVVLTHLRTMGIRLSIDDFGTGYSSLSHLARMPANEVKIDKSFVQGLESNTEYAAVVRSAIDMGHSLGMKVVAEGIETQAAAQQLRAFGCDIAQGYLYAKPMSCEDLQVWLQGKERAPIIAVPIGFNVDEVTDTVNLATY